MILGPCCSTALCLFVCQLILWGSEEPLVCHGSYSRWRRFSLSAAGARGQFPPDEWTLVLCLSPLHPSATSGFSLLSEELLTSRKNSQTEY